jgi:ABC-type lipoprotein export system ATPase subunit
LPEKQKTFHGNGIGPFTVGCKKFRQEILKIATSGVHISECRGAGKTTLLQLLGCDLKDLDKEVYYFDTATTLNDTTLTQEVAGLIEKKRKLTS